MNNKKQIAIGSFLLFLIIAGIFYCFKCQKNVDDKVIFSSFEENKEENDKEYDTKKGNTNDESNKKDSNIIKKSDIDDVKTNVCVHVCGAVKLPGVYELKSGARIIDAIKLAGGLKKDAKEDSINQAAIISDGEKIYVLSKTEVKEMGVNTKGSSEKGSKDMNTVSKKVNINTASAQELMTISGVGQAKADSIIKYREENGGFKDIEEIKNITGIKEKMFDKVKNSITIN